MKSLDYQFRERMANVAYSLCNSEGGVSLGGRKLHSQLTRSIKRNGDIPLDEISLLISSIKDTDAVVSAFNNDESIKNVVFAASNGGKKEVENLIGISSKAAEIVTDLLISNNFNVKESLRDIIDDLYKKEKSVVFQNFKYEREDVEFSTMFAYSRMWRSLKVPNNIKILKASCNAFVEMSNNCADDNSYHAIEKYMMSIGVVKRHGSPMSSQTSLLTNLNNECCKAFFSHGVIINRNFTSWIEDAISAACVWKSNKTLLSYEANVMLDNIFLLSCVDRMEPDMIDNTINNFENSIAFFNSKMIPPGVGLLWQFRERYNYHDEVLFKMFRRINAICRKYKK